MDGKDGAIATLETILCIDDDAGILEIAKLCLEMVGQYKVITALSGQEGLEIVRNVLPDLVLLDVMMPDKSGPETLAELRQIPAMQRVPILFVSSRMLPRDVEYYTSLGSDGVIRKPFDPMNLPTEVKKSWTGFHERII